MNNEANDYSGKTIIGLGLTETEKGYLIEESKELGFDPLFADLVNDVFQMILSDKQYDIQGVLISLETLYESKILNIHEIVATIENCCKMVGKPVAYVRAFVRSENIDPEILRDALKSELCSIFYLPSSTHESRIQTLREYLEGKNCVSPEIYELANPKKEKKRREDPNHIELTTRQSQVLKLIRERGASNKVIARTLKLSESTVKLHVGAILKKYRLSNRTQLAVFTEPKKKPSKESERKSSSTNNLTIHNHMPEFTLWTSETDYTNLTEIFDPRYNFDTTDCNKVIPVTEVYPKQ